MYRTLHLDRQARESLKGRKNFRVAPCPTPRPGHLGEYTHTPGSARHARKPTRSAMRWGAVPRGLPLIRGANRGAQLDLGFKQA